MDDHSVTGLKQERTRRVRIARIKCAIICLVAVCLIFSTSVCGVLLLKVYRLEQQMEYLLDNFTVSGQIDDESKQTNPGPEESSYFNLEENIQMDDTEYAYDVATAVEQKDNMAQPGDIPKVYLTFDDGPSSNTAEILDILKSYNVKATFFVVGKDSEEAKSLYRRIVEEGHTLGMHSYSHNYNALYDSLDSFRKDFSDIQNYLYEVTGQECLFYRFPGGSSNHAGKMDVKECISYLNEQGITYFDWNVSSKDATSHVYTPDELVKNVMADVAKYKTSIVLMHDAQSKTSTVKALAPMIEALQGMGAEILPIDERTTVVQHIAAASVKQ